MRLQSIRIDQFRNLKTQLLHFEPGCQLLIGPNGAGKTNILEAIYTLLTGRSFRTHRLSETLLHGAQHSFLEAQVLSHGISHLLQMKLSNEESRHSRRLWLNRNLQRDWSGLFPCSCWIPEDLDLVRSGPSNRRRLLDHHLLQMDPLYGHHLSRYAKALEQRHALLKMGRLVGLDLFEEQMALSASYLTLARIQALYELEGQFQQRLGELGFSGDHRLLYESGVVAFEPAAFIAMWQRLRPQEMKLRQTLKGPHLDDFKIIFQGQSARHYASEGQARACVAALKIAEWQRLSLYEGQALLLIDEIGMGFDRERMKRIWSWLEGREQVFLTTPELFQSVGVNWEKAPGITPIIWPIEEGRLQTHSLAH